MALRPDQQALTDTLRTAICDRPPAEIVAEHVMERVPFLFSNDWPLYRAWRRTVAGLIEVDPCDVCIVGSACAGLSLNPYKKMKLFGDTSDVDVAIVSSRHFELAWRALRNTRRGAVRNDREWSAIENHRTRYVYWGCIAADKVLRFLPFHNTWVDAISHVRGVQPTAGRDISLRLYKDFESLRRYQDNSIKQLRAALLEGQ